MMTRRTHTLLTDIWCMIGVIVQINGVNKMPITSFAFSQENTPQKNIFYAVKKALMHCSIHDFINKVAENIILNVEMSPVQKMSIKFVCKSFPMHKDDDNINNLLMYVLYGKFQDVGFDEAVEDALTNEQREQCLDQILKTAQYFLNNHINSLIVFASMQFEAPDWQIPIPPEEPEE